MPKNRRPSPKNLKQEQKEQKKAKEPSQTSWKEEDGTMQQGLLAILFFSCAALSFLSFIEAAGTVGTWVDHVLGWIFGWARYAAPLLFASIGYTFLHPERYAFRIRNSLGLVFLVFSATALLHLFFPPDEFFVAAQEGRGGGYAGIVLSYPLIRFAGIWAALVILLALFLSGWLLIFRMSLKSFLLGFRRLHSPQFIGKFREKIQSEWESQRATEEEQDVYEEEVEDDDVEYTVRNPEDDDDAAFQPFLAKDVPSTAHLDATAHTEQLSFIPSPPPVRKVRRTIDLPLDLLMSSTDTPTGGDIESNKLKIKKTLESFGIDVEMSEVHVGPMVSQYTLRPAEGIKLNQITTLSDDIALALAAHPIRIEAPIPGKALVGIEVPNKAIARVTLKDIFLSKEFKKRKTNIELCLGKDVSGQAFLTSLQSLPHLLIAGSTGSGKSVCINSIILSLLYQNSPDDLKFIMVDPKRVELSLYNGIPHLLTPVITDVEKTINALKWSVAEMDRRYDLLSREGKRNIESYNEAVDPENRLPYLVLIIDELADLMSSAAQSVEAAIVRLAQMSRAVGIHLVLATQRPSVNVITGLIKANMPARCAFSVASSIDSRTILDFSGAEKLLGRGDMLYIDAQLSKPRRLQGAFVESKEIENVVAYLREQGGEPEYEHDVIEPTAPSSLAGFLPSDGTEESDELLSEAREIILSAGKASASLLQRRLRVGYARAARLLDILEEQGFIGPADGARPREVLSTDQPADAEEDAFTDRQNSESDEENA